MTVAHGMEAIPAVKPDDTTHSKLDNPQALAKMMQQDINYLEMNIEQTEQALWKSNQGIKAADARLKRLLIEQKERPNEVLHETILKERNSRVMLSFENGKQQHAIKSMKRARAALLLKLADKQRRQPRSLWVTTIAMGLIGLAFGIVFQMLFLYL